MIGQLIYCAGGAVFFIRRLVYEMASTTPITRDVIFSISVNYVGIGMMILSVSVAIVQYSLDWITFGIEGSLENLAEAILDTAQAHKTTRERVDALAKQQTTIERLRSSFRKLLK